nr:FeoB-associated Cys-rich membrane protein [Desulfobacteraceae bacterium]
MQTLAVWLIVLLAAIYVGRRYFNSLRGKHPGCNACGSCADGCGGKKDGLPSNLRGEGGNELSSSRPGISNDALAK